jgi:hypothetical protein
MRIRLFLNADVASAVLNVGVPELASEKLQEFRYHLDGLESVVCTRDAHRFHKVGQLFRAEPQNAGTYNSSGRISPLVEHAVKGCGLLKNFRT